MSIHDELIATVAEILDLLTAHGDVYVVDRLRDYRDQLERQHFNVVRTLLSEATGSMGSLRDRYLCVDNGDRITEAEQEPVNARLGELVVRLAEQARAALALDQRA
jgi:nucleoside-diphosphate-sugar epimerase